jgi:hypothetical protein
MGVDARLGMPLPAVGGQRTVGRLRLRELALREGELIIVLALYVAALVRLTPFELVQDSWLTLVSGQEIANHGLPAHDTLTVLSHGVRWIDQQWLAHLVYYGLFALGGIKAVVLLHVMAVVAAFGLAMFAARSLGASPRAVFWTATASIFVAPWAWQLRAQSLAYLPFVAVVWLIARDSHRPSREVFLVFPILILWANLHGSVVIGVGLVMLQGLVFAFQQLTAKARRQWWLARSAALVALPPLCLIASPYGLALVGYYRMMLIHPVFAPYVGEWRPPTFQSAAIPFFVLALAAVWLVGRSGRRLTGFEKLAVVATILGGLLAIRSIVWFALAALVLVPRCLDAVFPSLARAPRPGRPLRVLTSIALAALPLMLLALVFRPASVHEQRFSQRAADTVASIARRDPSVKAIASERYADWLLWKVPALRGRLAFDVRFELNTASQMAEINDLHSRVGLGWQRLARGYRLIVLDRELDKQIEPALVRRTGARTVFADDSVLVLWIAPARLSRTCAPGRQPESPGWSSSGSCRNLATAG